MKRLLSVFVIAAAGAVVVATAMGRPGGQIGASALPSASCGPLFYKGSGTPQLLIASDLPLQGAGRAQPLTMVKAIQYVLEVQYKFKAGKFTVGYQACDDSTAQQGGWEPAKCTSNAWAYASEPKLVGVLGTFNSDCAKLVVPILNRAPNGPVTMVSAADTSVGLTHLAPWNDPDEPKIYYPTGERNYTRVVTTDDYQGPYAADLLKRLNKRNVFVLHDNQTFGKEVANAFQLRAKRLGMKVSGFEAWDARATSYEAIGERIRLSGADSVYLSGTVLNNGVKLLKDLRGVVGTAPTFVGPDSWSPFSTTLGAGPAAQGMLISIAGPPTSKLGAAGQTFLAHFRKYQNTSTSTVDGYAVYAAQTAQILLAAIARSNGTRASVNTQVFKTNVKDGIMGSFRFDANGDISSKAISFYELKGKDGVFKELVAPGL